MKKNLMFGSVVTAVMLLGTGCGGGSSSSDSDTTSNTSTTPSQKVGYYLDSAVAGVSYSCVDPETSAEEDNSTSESSETTTTEEDNTSTETSTAEDDNTSTETSTTEDDNTSTETSTTEDDNTSTTNKQTRISYKTNTGTTSIDGSFTYEEGQVCTFSIGGVVLREIDTATLEDNIVFEDDITTAKFLQTLDNDGNPDNGIQINAEVSNAIASGKVDLGGSIPQTDEEINDLVSQLQDEVETYKGEATGEEEAQSHLEDTRSAIEAMNGHVSVSAEAETDNANVSVEGESEGSTPETPMSHISDNANTEDEPSNTPLDPFDNRENADGDNNTTHSQVSSEGEASASTEEGSSTVEGHIGFINN